MIKPIWKDSTLGFTASTPYVVSTDRDGVLYKGRVDMQPDGVCEILSNKTCQYYVYQDFTLDSGVTQNEDACKHFFVKDGGGSILGEEDFLCDWSYEDITFSHNYLSHPVNGHMDPRMKFYCSFYNDTPFEAEILEDLRLVFDKAYPFLINFYGDVLDIHYTANTPFTVYTTTPWLTVEKIGGDTGTLRLTAPPNEDGPDRHGSFCVTWRGADAEYHTRCYDVTEQGIRAPLDHQIWIYSPDSNFLARVVVKVSGGTQETLELTYLGEDLWRASASDTIISLDRIWMLSGDTIDKIILSRRITETLGNYLFWSVSGQAAANYVKLGEVEFTSIDPLTIGSYGFSMVNTFGKITFPEGLAVTLGDSSLHGAGVNQTTPLTIDSLDNIVVYGNSALESRRIAGDVYIKDRMLCYRAFNAAGFDSLRIGSGVTWSGGSQFSSIRILGDNAVDVVVEEGVTTLPDQCFYHASGITVSLPSTLTSIGNYAFLNVTIFNSSWILNSDCVIGNNAFELCTVPFFIEARRSLTIGSQAFHHATQLMGMAIYGDASIGRSAFCGVTSLTTVWLGGESNYIAANAFKDTNITSVTINRNVTLEQGAFSACTAEIAIGGVISGGASICRNSGLKGAIKVGTCGSRAFLGCTGVTSIYIDASCTSLGYHMFEGIQLTDITYGGPKESWPNISGTGDYGWVNGSAIRYIHCTNGVIDIGSHA